MGPTKPNVVASPRSKVDRRRLAIESVTLIGVALVAVGAWLPWLVLRPGYTGPARRLNAYVAARHYVIKGLGWWALGLATLGVGNAVRFSRHSDRAGGVARGVGGLGVVLLALVWILDWGNFDCLYVPGLSTAADCTYVYGPGIFVMAYGGVLVAFAGTYQFVTATSG